MSADRWSMNLRPAILGAAAALTLTTGCAAGMTGSPQVLDSAVASVAAASEPATFTMDGALTLYDYDTVLAGCFTDGGYSDIGFGTDVVISDDTGRKIAVGNLAFGYASNGTCIFPFTVEGVPNGAKFYDVEISHRGAVTYTANQAHGYVEVALGN